MNWDADIWAPCRLGEPFTLREFGSEHTEYLLSIKADWFGQHGDASSVRAKEHLLSKHPYNVRVGAGPRPWTNCWTYEAKIKITPPTWVWDYADDLSFGLEIGQKRTGERQQIRLREVAIKEGQAVYVFTKKDCEPGCTFYLESVPLLDAYFAPIWPVKAEPEQEQAAPEDGQQQVKPPGFPWFYYYTFDLPPPMVQAEVGNNY